MGVRSADLCGSLSVHGNATCVTFLASDAQPLPPFLLQLSVVLDSSTIQCFLTAGKTIKAPPINPPDAVGHWAVPASSQDRAGGFYLPH